MKNVKHYRQGDVYITKVEYVNTEGYTKRQPKGSNLILAYGEVTGHHHSINLLDTPDAELLENPSGDMILKLNGFATITHQEHAPIVLNPGFYECFIQEEYDPEGMRRVQD